MKKICFVATIPAVVHSFLKDHIHAAAQQWEVAISTHLSGVELLSGLEAHFHPIPFERKISPWRDLRTLIQLIRLFRRERFDLVHSIMPKTGLLTMAAAWFCRVPYRLHTFTGQVWATKQGWKRSALKLFDKFIVMFATQILVDSPSQRDFLVSEGVVRTDKAQVLGFGSICGVDTARFHPDEAMKIAKRKELGISPNDTVILFLGRLNRDKGMLDLATAFAAIVSQRQDVCLVLVGAEEDVSFARMQAICGEYRQRMHKVDFTRNPEKFMAMADIFCLPSYREGFGQVIIEAGASCVPTVASNIYGVTDAVADGETGLLFPAGDVPALTESLQKLIEDRELCKKMGIAAQKRAKLLFSSQLITQEMLNLYRTLLT